MKNNMSSWRKTSDDSYKAQDGYIILRRTREESRTSYDIQKAKNEGETWSKYYWEEWAEMPK